MIVHDIVIRLTEYLQRYLIDEVPDGVRAADVVQSYRYQDSRIENALHVYVTGGNSTDPNDMDGRIDTKSMESLGIRIPSGEIGGGHLWWRKGRVEVGCYFIRDRFEQVEAGLEAHSFFGRVCYYTERVTLTDLVDDFGERAYKISVYGTNFFESGGPLDQYIWRGTVLWQVLTQRPL